MKKSLRILFVMMLALSIVLSLASCDLLDSLLGNDTHTHEFVDGECECGETDPDYQPPHEHTYVNGKCECGESDPNYQPPHEHNFVDGKCQCGAEDPNYQPPKEPELVMDALPTNSGAHLSALETVANSGVKLLDRAVAVYSIDLELDGEKVDPEGKVEVSVPVLIPEVLAYDVYHIMESGDVEYLPSRVENGMIIFETAAFSDFVFVTGENYNIENYTIASPDVQVFTPMTLQKETLVLAIKGATPADVTLCINGEERVDLEEADGAFVLVADFFYGEKIKVSVTPKNGYTFAYYSLLDYVASQDTAYYTYYTESEIEITLDDSWDGFMFCQLFAPDADLEERELTISANTKDVPISDLTFTVNGEEMKGESASNGDGTNYRLTLAVKNGDVLTLNANLPKKCRFKSIILRDSQGNVIEESKMNNFTFAVTSELASIELVIEELDYLGMDLDGRAAGWGSIRGNMHTGIRYLTVVKGSSDANPADLDLWIYTDYQEYLLTPDQYTVDLGGYDINTPGVYQVKYTFIEDPDFFIYFNITVVEEETIDCDFSTIPDGEQYANETVTFGDVTVSTHNNGCYFAGQLRIYDNNTNDGYVVIEAPRSPRYITSLTLVAGNNKATLEVCGSHDGEEWFHIEDVSVVKEYATYTVTLDPNEAYTYLKLDAEGAQIRIKSLHISHVEAEPPYVVTAYAETDIDFSFMGSVSVSVDGGEFTEYANYHQLLFDAPPHTITFRQQPKEGYVFVGWYLRYKDANGENTTFLITTDDQCTMFVGLEAQFEARYEPIE